MNLKGSISWGCTFRAWRVHLWGLKAHSSRCVRFGDPRVLASVPGLKIRALRICRSRVYVRMSAMPALQACRAVHRFYKAFITLVGAYATDAGTLRSSLHVGAAVTNQLLLLCF